MIAELIYLAVSCGFFGIVITFLMLYVCQYFGVDISQNWWVVAVPVVLAVVLSPVKTFNFTPAPLSNSSDSPAVSLTRTDEENDTRR